MFPTKTNKRNLICLQNSSNTAEREVNLYCQIYKLGIGKIVESFAFKIYHIVVCLWGSEQQTLLEKESFVKYQENENLQ